MRYLFDENTSRHLVEYMRILGQGDDVSHVSSVYGAGIGDDLLIPSLVVDGYVLVTNDQKMKQVHRRRLLDFDARVLFLPRQYSLGGKWEQSAYMLKHWRKIRAAFESLVDARLVAMDWEGRLKDITAQTRSVREYTPRGSAP